VAHTLGPIAVLGDARSWGISSFAAIAAFLAALDGFRDGSFVHVHRSANSNSWKIRQVVQKLWPAK
jgi:hypothetical protein